jgi:hypothetical protein
MVASGTIADLKRNAARRVIVELREPVPIPFPVLQGVTVVSNAGRRIELDVQGPLGPVLHALATLPVHDLQVESFTLEDFVARYYAGH